MALNKLAASLGYELGTEKKSFEKAKEAENSKKLEMAKKHIIAKLAKSDVEKRAFEKIIDDLIRKNEAGFKSGKYSLLTVDELLVLGNGTIVDESANIVVWTQQEFLDWSKLTDM